MTLVERLRYVLEMDTQGAIRGVEQFDQRQRRGLGDAEERMGRLGRQSMALGAGLIGAAAVGGAALFKIGDMASDAEESFSAMSQVVGESAEKVDTFARNAADIGQTRTEALQAVTTFAALAKEAGLTADASADMGIELTQLASDIGSFKNAEPAEVVEALSAALRGSFEPMQRFDVLLNQQAVNAKAVELGLAQSTGAVSQGAKVQATYALIMERTVDAQGDFARTADNAANAQRRARAEIGNLGAELGSAVVPVIGQAATGIADFVANLREVNEATGGAVGQMALFSVGAAGAFGAVATLAGGILTLKANIDKIKLAFLGANPVVLALTAAATAGAAIWLDYAGAQREARERAEGLTEALSGTAEALTESSAAAVLTQDSFQKAIEPLNLVGLTVEDILPALESGTDAFELFQDMVLDNVSAGEAFDHAFKNASPEVLALRDSLQAAYEAGDINQAQLLDLADGLDEAADSFDDAKESARDDAIAKIDAAIASGDLAAETGNVTRAKLEEAESYREVNVALQEADTALQGNVVNTDAARDAGLAYVGMLQARGTEVLNAAAAEERLLAATQAQLDQTLAAANADLAYRQAVDATEGALQRLNEAKQAAAAGDGDAAVLAEAVADAQLAVEGAALRQAAAASEAAGASDDAAASAAIQAEELQGVADQVAAGSPLRTGLQNLVGDLEDVDGQEAQPSVTLDTTAFDASIRAVETRLRRLNSQTANAGGQSSTGSVTARSRE